MPGREAFWDTSHPGNRGVPPVTETKVRLWEDHQGIRLPATLAEALTAQDGGVVRGTSLWINPLCEFTPLSAIQWEGIHFEDEDRGEEELSKIFEIASTGDGVNVLLDYNGQDGDTQSEPRILFLWHNLGREIRGVGDISFDELIESERTQIEGEENEPPAA